MIMYVLTYSICISLAVPQLLLGIQYAHTHTTHRTEYKLVHIAAAPFTWVFSPLFEEVLGVCGRW